MSNYNSLKTTIDANIKQNGRQEITGQILNSVLNQMVTTLGAGYQFAGVATTATKPGSPDAKVFYIANGKGTYTNFGRLEVTEDEVVVLYWDSSWHKEATGIASNDKLTELDQKNACILGQSVNLESNIASKAYNINILKGDVEIEINSQTQIFNEFTFYKGETIVGYVDAGLIQPNVSTVKKVTLSDNCDKIVILKGGSSEQIATTEYFKLTSQNTIIELVEKTDSLVEEVGGLVDKVGGTRRFISNAVTQEFDVSFVRNNLSVSMTSTEAVFLTIQFLKGGQEVGLIDAVLVSVGSVVNKTIPLMDNCDKMVVSKAGMTHPQYDTTIDVTFDNLSKVGDIEKLDTEVFGSVNAVLNTTDNSTSVYSTLPKGNITFHFGEANSSAWYSGAAYDIDGELIASFDDQLIKANTELDYTIQCDRDVYKIVIGNINRVAREVVISSSDSLTQRVSALEEKVAFDFAIDIPSVVYLRTAQEFSIWYRNVIMGSQAFENGNYSIRCQKKSGSTYSNIGTNCTYKKFNYISNEETEFDLEIRIIDTYSRAIVISKVVHFIVNDPANVSNTTPSIVLLGDSFTDGHRVCQYIYTFLTDDGIDAVAIGVNSGYGAYKDDAWAGYGIDWFYNSASGYLRSDRPLEDAIWDAGWGENEEHGWTPGQTYNDLTAEQRSHGHTKNEFYNPTTKVFDFSYYMSTYHPGVNAVNIVILNIGLNDTSWAYKTDGELQELTAKLDAMITSIHSFDNTTKIILCQTTPQPKEDAITSNMGSSWLTAPTCKNNQERWNNTLISHFDTSEYRTNKVFIAPLSSNFDTENAIYTTTIHPDKFDDTITEVITDDIHPDVIGAKYISDTIVNTVEGVVDL